MSAKRDFRSRKPSAEPGYPTTTRRTLAALGTAAAIAALTSCGAAPNPDIEPYEETDAGLVDAGAQDGGADAGQ
jgi:hypothetical protein